jgi:preprotein translocase subunit YajC
MNKMLFTLFTFATGTLCAQDGGMPALPQREQGFWQTLVMISVALVFFYLILWRPEQKRRKEMDTQRDSMKQGDKVTAMGIIGSVLRVQEETVILKMYDGAKIEVLKHAITDVLPSTSESEKAKLEKANV